MANKVNAKSLIFAKIVIPALREAWEDLLSLFIGTCDLLKHSNTAPTVIRIKRSSLTGSEQASLEKLELFSGESLGFETWTLTF